MSSANWSCYRESKEKDVGGAEREHDKNQQTSVEQQPLFLCAVAYY